MCRRIYMRPCSPAGGAGVIETAMALPNEFRIEAATVSDLAAIEALLRSHRLPTEGASECVETAVVARLADRTIGCAALEIYPSGVLLRSVAVDEPWRRKGLGTRLTGAALDLARRNGARAAYLL